MHASTDRPIGVFDSGIGGLSVLQALQAELPNERFVYLADSANAPYGERGDAFVAERSHAIADYLVKHHQIKALVVACNTATAAAIHEVRSRYPQMPLIGVEPALKPAVAQSRTRRIGVIGTRGTLTSRKFTKLLDSLQGQAEFVIQPCMGLAHAIEQSTVQEPDRDAVHTEVWQLCQTYTQSMGVFGHEPGQIDTLVLGCTHYVFAIDDLRDILGESINLLSTGEPVAKQTRRLLEGQALLAAEPPDTPANAYSRTQLLTTGSLISLQAAAMRWLHLPAQQCAQAQGLR
jgi:glutamate racemase